MPSPVDVVLPVGGQIIVDDQRHLLHINASGQQVSRNQHTGGARAELMSLGEVLGRYQQTLDGSFSAASKPSFASKYVFFSIFQGLSIGQD